MKIFKPKFWNSKKLHFFSLVLWPISFIIQIFFFINIKVSKKKNLDIPVICIGNIYLGGTGKTPLSIKIGSLLKKLNKNPAIIKKFYKQHYDEIELIKDRIGNIFCDKSRILASNNAIKKGFNILVFDDGYQDHNIKKDLNILCFNEKQLIGNGFTIPSGPLRESLKTVRKCQIIFINGNKNESFEDLILSSSKNTKIYYTKYIPVNIEKYINKKFIAFAGIGNPDNFFDLLIENNVNLEEKIHFPDHYSYSQKDVDKIIQKANKKGAEIITTEKDFFRIKNLNHGNINYLSINVNIDQEDKFIEELKNYI